MKTNLDRILIQTNYAKARKNLTISTKLKILTSVGIKIIAMHKRKRKRLRIISDTENESEIKDADNEENIVKAGSQWMASSLFIIFQIWPAIDAWILYKQIIVIKFSLSLSYLKSKLNYARKVMSNYICIKCNKCVCEKCFHIHDRVWKCKKMYRRQQVNKSLQILNE